MHRRPTTKWWHLAVVPLLAFAVALGGLGWPALAQQPVTISVIDNGTGVPAEDIHRLFEKFQTGSAGDTGLGLGLYLARQVVEAHSGTISYEPGDQGGAAFSFVLPVRRSRQ